MAAWTLGLGGGCGGGAASGPGEPPPFPQREPNEFGAFNFTIESRSVPAQVDLLVSNGYQGVALEYSAGLLSLYLARPTVAAGHLRVIAVLIGVQADLGVDHTVVGTAMGSILGARALPCLRIHSPRSIGLEQLAVIVREVADIVAELDQHGVLVLYPHAGEPMADVEDALDVLLRAGRSNVKLSLHLVHELKAGNRDRLDEVIGRVAPHLALASINGADSELEGNLHDYSRSIRPLAAGNLDVEQLYLRPLLDSGYSGPIILHTWALNEPPEEHYAASMARWREMMASSLALPPRT